MGVALTSLRGGARAACAVFGAVIAAIVALGDGQALAQGTGIVGQGSAVVTGFSQATITTAPPGADPYDYYMINPAGPAARVVDLSVLGAPGTVSPAAKPFTVTAAQVGQVFGVTLDNAPRPNIYVAATSAYGLEITVPDATGIPHRIHTGAPGANFAPGQFGLGGGPGSVWRIDGTTGAVSLLANVPNAGPAALGGMTFDANTQSIYVADRTSGKVYRYATNGVLKGTFDHGVEARPAAGLPPIPQPPVGIVNIQSPGFNTEDPNTWGTATPARRVMALAVYKNRLYYSVAQGPQIWSSGIGAGGAISGADARMEVELPSLDTGEEIASIDFDSQGYMYVAERGATTGDYFLIRLADDGQSRVVRYRPKLPGDPTPGLWTLVPDQYSTGMPPNYTNANGGVALSYGYTFNGSIDYGACDQTVWATGERLLDPGNGTTGFPTVDGLQGTQRSLVQPQNTPPSQSWYVDYDDSPGYADFRGHMGAIATRPCPTASAPPLPPPPVVNSCPPGTYFDGQLCIIIPTCPPGTSYSNGACVYPTCPPGFVLDNAGQCVPPTVVCPPGTFFYQGQCVPLACPPGMLLQPNGQCLCPTGTAYFNGKCVPPSGCPVGSIQLPNGVCTCPLGLIFGNGVCQPQTQGCPPNQELWNGYCVAKCPPNQIHFPPNGACQFPPVNCPPAQDYFNGLCVNKCPPGQDHTLPNGTCAPAPINCPLTQELFNGLCVNKCQNGQVHSLPNGVCITPPACPGPNNELWNGLCVPKCQPLFEHKLPNGACGPIFTIPIGPIQTLCLDPNKELWEGKCVDKCPGLSVHHEPDGACGPPILIPVTPVIPLCQGATKEIWEGKCVDKCTGNLVHQEPNGACGPAIPQLPPIGPIFGGQPPIQVSPAALCASQGKDLFNGKCVDKCGPLQVHKDPDGGCGPIVIVPLQNVQPTQASCASQNMDLYAGMCVPKCGPNQEHKAPNGACGAITIQVNPGQLPIIPVPTAASCAAQNMDLYDGKCVPKCGPNQEHKAPNGACGAITIQVPPGGALQVTPTQATCAAQNQDLYDGKCVPKCGPNQEHKAPNGACGAITIQVPPGGALQVTPTQATCAAQNQDLYDGKCVPKCGPTQEHKAPNGACGAITIQVPPGGALQVTPTAATCAAQNKDLYDGKCVDKCGPLLEHKAPDGACGPVNAGQGGNGPQRLPVVTEAACAAQGKDLFDRQCVDKCKGNLVHLQPDGMCGVR
jgi:hypothetical protein